MLRRLAAAASLFAGASVACQAQGADSEEPPPAAGPEPSVWLSWNLHRLTEEGVADQARLTAIRTKLQGWDPDVVALQEVGGEGVAERLAAALGPDGEDFEIAYCDGNDGAGFGVAVLSRWPMGKVRHHHGERFTLGNDPGATYQFARDALEVHLDLPRGPRATLLALHFKSQRDDDPQRRWAEAERVRDLGALAHGVDPSAAVLLAGDLNEDRGSRTWDALAGEGPRCAPASGEERDSPFPCEGGFVSLTSALPAQQRWTHAFSGRRQQLDDVQSWRESLTPSALTGAAGAAGNGSSESTSELSPKRGASSFGEPIVRRRLIGDAGGLSDHRPVIVELTFPSGT